MTPDERRDSLANDVKGALLISSSSDLDRAARLVVEYSYPVQPVLVDGYEEPVLETADQKVYGFDSIEAFLRPYQRDEGDIKAYRRTRHSEAR